MRARGERSARAAQVATLETRRAKEYAVPVDRLSQEWRARAAEHGLDRWAIHRVVGRPRRRAPEPEEGVTERLVSAEGLTRKRSTFCRRDVVQAFAEAARDGARVEVIEAAADAASFPFLSHDRPNGRVRRSGRRRRAHQRRAPQPTAPPYASSGVEPQARHSATCRVGVGTQSAG
jgi:hypothetical protein